ncbi:phosphate-starvation-inducible protein PsiE [Bacillus mycoides]|uniref:Protein PsiE homolog n=2 Tax=Bacillaceae TaxID=186817 RepID=R8MVR4_BACCX|nr:MULTISPECIES: phosphate-starvation-inducible protein PsiE [Bacillus]EOP38104.1 phosphate-starvation-inducible protein PsiE [Bacillus cereus VD146]ETT79271.1 phosphate-starvation-inducible protein PsiE [Bacillus mycoides FSL H7-687]MBJ8017555.1 phosphate-starvation-inducible protein PsiE [Bacillus cereus group sp. N34]MCP9227738.1 phosphate-starvation-inducible protein PsiE [Bacillus mycoides]MCQ6532920.1 phosphate-starvation-inducible protein PsiE [Bacillus mycoides]
MVKNFKKVFSFFPIVLQYIINVALICLGIVLSVFLMKEVIQFIQELKLNSEESSYHLIDSIVVFFLYFEFIVMIIKYFQMNFHFPLRYFIYIGITAIIRLIIIDHDSPMDSLIYACAILVLISALFIANSKIMRRDLEE